MSELDTLTQAAITLADAFAVEAAKAERAQKDERKAVVCYLRRMADLWDGSARSPLEVLRGAAAYIESGGHRESW